MGLPGVVVGGVLAVVARGGLSGSDRDLNINKLFLVKLISSWLLQQGNQGIVGSF